MPTEAGSSMQMWGCFQEGVLAAGPRVLAGRWSDWESQTHTPRLWQHHFGRGEIRLIKP